jgi:SAM-dependent methyltransferase
MQNNIDIDVDDIAPYIKDRRFRKGRLRIIENEVDFTGKRVLDLGCADGSLTFLLARKAKSITAIDANVNNIEQNKKNARKLGFDNIDFICERIKPQFLRQLPRYDIVVFVSVFHHMLAHSNTYAWNDQGESELSEILDIIKSLGTIYIFEMGEAHGYGHIGRPLKAIAGEETYDWVSSHVYGSSFQNVKLKKGAAYEKFPYCYFPSLRRLTAFESSPVSNEYTNKAVDSLNKLFGINYKDFRDIYIGFK